MMKKVLALIAVLAVVATADAQCYRTSACYQQTAAVAVPVYAPAAVAVQSVQTSYCAPAAASFAAPAVSYYQQPAAFAVQSVGYQQSFVQQRAFVQQGSYGYGGTAFSGHGTRFLGPPIQRGFGGGGRFGGSGDGFTTGGGLIGLASNLTGISPAGVTGIGVGILGARAFPGVFGLRR